MLFLSSKRGGFNKGENSMCKAKSSAAFRRRFIGWAGSSTVADASAGSKPSNATGTRQVQNHRVRSTLHRNRAVRVMVEPVTP